MAVIGAGLVGATAINKARLKEKKARAAATKSGDMETKTLQKKIMRMKRAKRSKRAMTKGLNVIKKKKKK